MSLDNLLKIGQLKAHPADRGEIQKLLAAAARNLADAGNTAISLETRFDCAYKIIMQSALATLMANGYRPSTHVPGHQMTTIQSLAHTIKLNANRMVILDTLRKKRNLNDYIGADLDVVSTRACVAEATRLLKEVRAWLKAHRPELA
ncbi:MAG: DNA-binding protein [Gammaproteobacteria bacterium]